MQTANAALDIPLILRSNKKTGWRQPFVSNLFKIGARYRTRTCDLLHVKQMLYQLS